jgi:hypothetical protein
MSSKNGSKKFIDNDFPPTIDSITSDLEDQKKYLDLEWVRATKLAALTNDDGDNKLFTESLGPKDIMPGMI